MIRSHYEACKALGLGPFATQQEIKTAYHDLAKQYHPDSRPAQAAAFPQANSQNDSSGNPASLDLTRYMEITEAYRFLSQEAAGNSTARVIGGRSTQQQKREEQEAYDRWYQRRKEEKAKEFEERVRRQKEEAALREKQDKEYREAMEKINTIILAEALKKMIHADKPE